ncbi:unnamed protein product [Didymodactylos carnosus]|uniref:Uncharacterized protein n=1 Tax=Didymodactylos carnosus TaxID=1234261 RepID=A0A814LLG1_9BILA|nr:unnamed protein product [Didymodactylos carnosus]CAF1065813.1 unnamed protein product [Didymodactylos carnosus]CAF3692565.1 unnamed protein product [Didymodactylos carnosus]CAF3833512.1 unnamed protein product [Didymodactylos carnosus]
MDEPQLPSSDNDPDTYFVNMVVDDIEQGSDILSQDSLANNAINNANNAINNAINNGNNPNNPNNNIFDTISETTATIAKYTNRVINGTIDEVKEIASGTKNNPKTSFFSGMLIKNLFFCLI